LEFHLFGKEFTLKWKILKRMWNFLGKFKWIGLILKLEDWLSHLWRIKFENWPRYRSYPIPAYFN